MALTNSNRHLRAARVTCSGTRPGSQLNSEGREVESRDGPYAGRLRRVRRRAIDAAAVGIARVRRCGHHAVSAQGWKHDCAWPAKILTNDAEGSNSSARTQQQYKRPIIRSWTSAARNSNFVTAVIADHCYLRQNLGRNCAITSGLSSS
jgi:hypothetical protein